MEHPLCFSYFLNGGYFLKQTVDQFIWKIESGSEKKLNTSSFYTKKKKILKNPVQNLKSIYNFGLNFFSNPNNIKVTGGTGGKYFDNALYVLIRNFLSQYGKLYSSMIIAFVL